MEGVHMLRQITLIILFIAFSGTCNAGQSNNQWNQKLFDALHFDSHVEKYIVNVEQINIAFKNGANPNWIIPTGAFRGYSILHYYVDMMVGVKQTRQMQVLKEFFDHGAKVQPIDGEILWDPIDNGFFNIVKLLLNHGASAKFWSKGLPTKLTPIEYATKKGYQDIVALLESHGAKESNIQDTLQDYFLDAAANGSVHDLDGFLKQGVLINEQNKEGETAIGNALCFISLHEFKGSKAKEKVSFLLGHGADPNKKTSCYSCRNCLPTHAVIIHTGNIFTSSLKKYQQRVMVLLKELLDHGAYVSGRDMEGMTPLHYAAKYNNIYAAKLLLERGALVMPKDNQEKTPLDYAESAEMIKLLKEHGAKEM